MPKDIAVICDRAIDFATGNSPMPDNIEKLYEWLVWESEGEEQNANDWFFSVDSLILFDDDLRDFLELSDDTPVTDGLRIKYTRALIDQHAYAQETDSWACSFKLKKRGRPEVFACCLGVFAGHGGPEYEWFGLFSSKASFFEHLRSRGWLVCGTPSKAISDNEILRFWSR